MEEEKVIKVMVAVDDSPVSENVLNHCGRTARQSKWDLTLIHVMENVVPLKKIPDTPLYREKKQEGHKILDRAQKTLMDHRVPSKTILAAGPIASEIVRMVEENQVDCIFLGQRGHRGLKRMLLGSVSDDVGKHAPCAVTIIR